jgi:hypothetical protein
MCTSLYFDNIAFSGVQHSWCHPDMVVREIVDDVCTPKEEVAEQIIAPDCGRDAERAAVSGNRISIALNNAI